MLVQAGEILLRLIALLIATGISQNLYACTEETSTAQFPKYAAMMSEQTVFNDNEYRGENALITLEEHPREDGILGSTFLYADILLPDVHNLKTYYMESEEDGLGGVAQIGAICQHVGAALAVNGDTYSSYEGKTAVRNGKPLSGYISGYDLCVLYENGEMLTYTHDRIDSFKTLGQLTENAWQAWSFGPALLEEDGSAIESFEGRTPDFLRDLHPRTAIGYFEPGHYCLLVVAGYQPSDPGVTLEELSQYFSDLGCKSAYNLDGGGSSHIWFHGKEIGYPSDYWNLPDVIYIADLSIPGDNPDSPDKETGG